jgi:hypothetical protein
MIRVPALFATLAIFSACDLLSPDRPEFEVRVSGAVELESVGAGGFLPHPGEQHWGDRGSVFGSPGGWNALGPPGISISHDGGVSTGRFRLARRDVAQNDSELTANLGFRYHSPGGYLERFEADSGYVVITRFTNTRVRGHSRAWATHVGTSDPPGSGLSGHAPAPDGDQVMIQGRFNAPPLRVVRTLSDTP